MEALRTQRKPGKYLAGSHGLTFQTFSAVKSHPFFNSINWSDLEKKRITPPFKPQVVSETDTRYFDSEFTGESVELTPPDSRGGLMDSIREEDLDEEPYFPGVSPSTSFNIAEIFKYFSFSVFLPGNFCDGRPQPAVSQLPLGSDLTTLLATPCFSSSYFFFLSSASPSSVPQVSGIQPLGPLSAKVFT